ncbi:Uncharacterised protein [Ectopseudomonas mendocina]|uniref:DUF6160 family protein n=1 Tax=Ectopseudomonas mendocina TaxID=300 RepID=UPI000DF8D071|nr:DUF6160 family protein [Pseudomonas mendocina]SUD35759.1 Uncharacterised protein [Pseudomonas mendocina]
MSTPVRTMLLPLLCAAALLAPPAQAALQALEDESLSQISGQAGLTIRLDLMARIDEIRWQDDGGSLSLRNVTIDNGCLKPSDCDGYTLGPAQLGASVPILGLEVPTLEVDVVKGSNGQSQLQLKLPNLTAINQQLGPLGKLVIRARVASDLYIGDTSIGNVALRDLRDINGTIKVWGH